MAGLNFRNISRPLEDGHRFSGFNLEIDDGEFVALVGRSGCGKAELIRMAEGYGGYYEGEVLINDRRITRFGRGGNSASLINEIPLMGTPRREIMHMLKQQVSLDEAAARVDSAARDTGAESIMDVRWSKLDPEGRLRAGMARAQALKAKVVLLIDPFEEMDDRTAARMRVEVMEFHKRTRTAFVIATSSHITGMALATRVVVLDGGSIRQSDTPQNIYDYPADRFVAEYFGDVAINMIPAELRQNGDEVYAVFGGNRILVPNGKLSKLVDQSYIGKKVLMGIRPENIRYEQAFISISPESAVEARVRHAELLGSETYLHLGLDGVNGDVVARVDPRCIASPGISMSLAIDSNRLHFFDIDTEKSIMSRL